MGCSPAASAFLPADLDLVMQASDFAVTVRVLNAKAEKREDVRLWPREGEGQLTQVSVSQRFELLLPGFTIFRFFFADPSAYIDCSVKGILKEMKQ